MRKGGKFSVRSQHGLLKQRISTDLSALSSQICCWGHKLCKSEAPFHLSFLGGEAGSSDASLLGCGSAASALCMALGVGTRPCSRRQREPSDTLEGDRNSGPLMILQLLKHYVACHALSLIILFLAKRAIASTIMREKAGYRGQSFTDSHVQKARALKLWLSMLISELFLISLCPSLSPCSYWPFMSYRVL